MRLTVGFLVSIAALACSVVIDASAGSAESTVGKVASLDAASGYLVVSSETQPRKATVVVNRRADLRPASAYVVAIGGAYYRDQLKELQVFGRVVVAQDLSREALAAGVADGLTGIRESDFLRALAAQRPMLVITTYTDKRPDGQHLTMAAIDPRENVELFKASVPMPVEAAERTDQRLRYPLFNSLVDWLRDNGLAVPGKPWPTVGIENAGVGILPCEMSQASRCRAHVAVVDDERLPDNRNHAELTADHHIVDIVCSYDSTFGRRGTFVSLARYRMKLDADGQYRVRVRRERTDHCLPYVVDLRTDTPVGDLLLLK